MTRRWHTSIGVACLIDNTLGGNQVRRVCLLAILILTLLTFAGGCKSGGDPPDPNPVPLAPAQLVVGAVNASTVNLQWKDNSNNETGFRVERSVTTDSNFQALGNTSANTTLYSDNTIEAGKKYYYRVKAVNSAGTSNPSNSVSVTVPEAEKTATLIINNYTPYAVISFKYNGGYGWYELVNTPSQIIGADCNMDYTFWLDSNVETIQVSIIVGFWGSSNPNDKNPRFTFTGSVTLTENQTSQYNIDVTVQNVLSNFKSSSDWTGQYWTYNPSTPHSAVLRFYSDGRWYLYKDNSYIESGYVIPVQWNNYSDYIYFKLKPTGDTIQYYYPNFKFFYKNGPPDWPQIEYVLQP